MQLYFKFRVTKRESARSEVAEGPDFAGVRRPQLEKEEINRNPTTEMAPSEEPNQGLSMQW